MSLGRIFFHSFDISFSYFHLYIFIDNTESLREMGPQIEISKLQYRAYIDMLCFKLLEEERE